MCLCDLSNFTWVLQYCRNWRRVRCVWLSLCVCMAGLVYSIYSCVGCACLLLTCTEWMGWGQGSLMYLHLAGCLFGRQLSTPPPSCPPLLPVKVQYFVIENCFPPAVFQDYQAWKEKHTNTSTRTCPSTIHRDMAVFPSGPGRNISVADRGLMLEMTKLDGAPGSSMNRKHEEYDFT